MGDGAQFFLELLHGNDLDFEVHLNTRPYAIACPAAQPWPAGISSDSTLTLAELEARPVTVVRATSSALWIDEPRIGFHADRTTSVQIRFKRLR